VFALLRSYRPIRGIRSPPTSRPIPNPPSTPPVLMAEEATQRAWPPAGHGKELLCDHSPKARLVVTMIEVRS